MQEVAIRNKFILQQDRLYPKEVGQPYFFKGTRLHVCSPTYRLIAKSRSVSVDQPS